MPSPSLDCLCQWQVPGVVQPLPNIPCQERTGRPSPQSFCYSLLDRRGQVYPLCLCTCFVSTWMSPSRLNKPTCFVWPSSSGTVFKAACLSGHWQLIPTSSLLPGCPMGGNLTYCLCHFSEDHMRCTDNGVHAFPSKLNTFLITNVTRHALQWGFFLLDSPLFLIILWW